MEAVKYKKGGVSINDELVLYALVRELVFRSTRLLPTHSIAELTQFDCRPHQLLGLRNLVAFNSLYVVTRGQFSCPVRSFFIFAHNQPLSPAYLKAHPLVQHLRSIRTKEEFFALRDRAKI